MGNRELEVFILKKIKEIKPNFQVKPAVDLKYGKKDLKLPRVISKTLSNAVIERYRGDILDEEKAIFKQYEVHRHCISLVFVLSENESYSDVAEIKKVFEHLVGADWLIAMSGENIVIEEITALVDISEDLKDSYTERYSFDMYIKTVDENIAEIEHIKAVEFDFKVR